MSEDYPKQLIELKCERMAYGPDSVAHTADGKTVLVRGGIPGDTVGAQITSTGSNFDRAQTVEVLEASPTRVDAPCPFVDVCGGCPWAHISYEQQLAYKRESVLSSLVRIGHFDAARAEELVRPCVAPGDAWGYRNKIELAASTDKNGMHLGMHAAQGDTVIRTDACPLLSSKNKKLVKSVAGALSYLAGSNGIQLLRVGIRSSVRTNEVEVALWSEPSSFPRAQAAKVLEDAVHPTSVVRVLAKGDSKARRVIKVERLSGKGSWAERIGQETMQVSAPSFFQVNTRGAEELVRLVMDGLSPREDDVVWDLYSGAGTFTLPMARVADWVEAVEIEGSSVRDLRRNLERSHIENVNVVGGDVALEEPEEEPDLIVVDPPRSGMDQSVCDMLVESGARAIAYVSCDPATLARDLARIEDSGTYTVDSVTPVDLFPQSYHVECVVLMTKK